MERRHQRSGLKHRPAARRLCEYRGGERYYGYVLVQSIQTKYDGDNLLRVSGYRILRSMEPTTAPVHAAISKLWAPGRAQCQLRVPVPVNHGLPGPDGPQSGNTEHLRCHGDRYWTVAEHAVSLAAVSRRRQRQHGFVLRSDLYHGLSVRLGD